MWQGQLNSNFILRSASEWIYCPFFCYRYPAPPFSFFPSLSPHLLSRRPFLLLSFSVSPYKPSQNAIHHILLSSAPLSASLSHIISSSHRRVDSPFAVKISLSTLNRLLAHRLTFIFHDSHTHSLSSIQAVTGNALKSLLATVISDRVFFTSTYLQSMQCDYNG